jgi:hypothetical protein
MKISEISEIDSKRQGWLVVALIAWLAMSAWEVHAWNAKGSLVGLAYIPFFLGLIIWRCAFQYEISIEEGKVSAVMAGLSYRGVWEAPMEETRMLMPIRKRMLLKELGVSRFSHQYSSLDANPLRVLLVQRKGKKNPHALLFKASDEFYEKMAQELKRQNRDIIIRTVQNTV